MKKLVLLLLFFGVSCIYAQGVFVYSQVTADPATGEIVAQATTHMIDTNPEVTYLDASVTTTLYGWGSVYGENDCSVGCAYAAIYGQVFQLGLQYTEGSGHYGSFVWRLWIFPGL